MYVKLVVFAAFLAVAACHDVTVGLTSGGKKIYDENITASPAIWRQSQTVTVNATEGDVIARIVITDNRPDKEGSVKITEGGEGQMNVSIELKSPTVFRGMDFNVQVYTVPENKFVRIENDTQTPVGFDTQVNENNTVQSHITEGAETITVEAPKSEGVKTPVVTGQDSTQNVKTNVQNNDNTDLESVLASAFPPNSTADFEKEPENPTLVAIKGKNPTKVPTHHVAEVTTQTTIINDISTTTVNTSQNSHEVSSIGPNDPTTEKTLQAKGRTNPNIDEVTSLMGQKITPIPMPYNVKH